jgi:hypothetical protein
VLSPRELAVERRALTVDLLLRPGEQDGRVLAEVALAQLVPAIALGAGHEQLRGKQLVLDASADAGQHDDDERPADQDGHGPSYSKPS